MTDKQPEALRLADILQHKIPSIKCLEIAAVELRRLHEENERFKAERDELNEVLIERDEAEDYIDILLDEVLGIDRAEWSNAYGRADALEEVRERIAKKEEQVQEYSAATAWQEGYDQGVADERTSNANIGICGFSAKVTPARNNPYTAKAEGEKSG